MMTMRRADHQLLLGCGFGLHRRPPVKPRAVKTVGIKTGFNAVFSRNCVIAAAVVAVDDASDFR